MGTIIPLILDEEQCSMCSPIFLKHIADASSPMIRMYITEYLNNGASNALAQLAETDCVAKIQTAFKDIFTKGEFLDSDKTMEILKRIYTYNYYTIDYLEDFHERDMQKLTTMKEDLEYILTGYERYGSSVDAENIQSILKEDISNESDSNIARVETYVLGNVKRNLNLFNTKSSSNNRILDNVENNIEYYRRLLNGVTYLIERVEAKDFSWRNL